MKDISEIIPINSGSIGTEHGIPTVDLRNVWTWLDLHRKYGDWAKYQFESLELQENQDFICFHNNVKANGEGRGGATLLTEYHVTLDAAKHIAMSSRTPRGREARNYFIEAEKRYRKAELNETEGDMLVRMAMAYRDQQRQIRAIEDQQREDQKVMIKSHENMLKLQQEQLALQKEIIEAKDNALLAIQSMQWVTIRQYVQIHQMQRQMPLSAQRAYATWLSTYCQERGFAMYKAATADKDWPYEKTYCIAVIGETLARWLRRYGNSNQEVLPEQ